MRSVVSNPAAVAAVSLCLISLAGGVPIQADGSGASGLAVQGRPPSCAATETESVMSVKYGVAGADLGGAVEGLKAAHLRMQCADLLFRAIADEDEEVRAVYAVISEVQAFIGQTAEMLSYLDRCDVWPVAGIVPTLHARLLQYASSAEGEFEGADAKRLIGWFVNAAVDTMLRDTPMEWSAAFEGFGKLMDELDRERRAAQESRERPVRVEATETASTQDWPTLPIIPGLFDRLVSLCSRYAAPSAGLTAEMLTVVMVNSALSGEVRGKPDLTSELEIYQQLLAEYGARDEGRERRSEPAGTPAGLTGEHQQCTPEKSEPSAGSEQAAHKTKVTRIKDTAAGRRTQSRRKR